MQKNRITKSQRNKVPRVSIVVSTIAFCLALLVCFTVNTQLANAAQPTVTTGAASEITSESGVMNGSVNPNGIITTYYFEYGLTASYGLKSDALDAGSGTIAVSVSSDLLGCTIGTTYYFRLVATNSAGTIYGAGKTFTTIGLKPIVTTESAASITSTTAVLNGTVNPNNLLTTYYFQYGKTTSYGLTTKTLRSGLERAVVSVKKNVSGLFSATLYHFRIVATNSAGTTYGSDKTFTTAAVLNKPTVNSGTPGSITATEAALSGTVNPNGLSTTCYFKYGITTSYGSTTAVKSLGSGSTTVAVIVGLSGLTANTTYYFQLVATNSAGTTYGSNKSFTTADAEEEEGTFTNSLNMTFNLIPAGTFTMGSPSDELGRYSDETQHQVTLTNDYYMQTTEVTQGQWKAVMGSNPSYFSSCGDNCPVEQVSWDDIQTFVTKLNAKGEGTYSLPTEAQWEYAARAGSITAFANGGITKTDCSYDSNLDAIGWYCYNAGGKTHSVAGKSPNNWGLYDMHGNVWEWCQDWYGDYSSVAATDPVGPGSGSDRVFRGGGWSYNARGCRSAFRGGSGPSDRGSYLGFRLVCSAGHQ